MTKEERSILSLMWFIVNLINYVLTSYENKNYQPKDYSEYHKIIDKIFNKTEPYKLKMGTYLYYIHHYCNKLKNSKINARYGYILSIRIDEHIEELKEIRNIFQGFISDLNNLK